MSTLSLGASGHAEGGDVNSTADARTRPDCMRAATPDNRNPEGAAALAVALALIVVFDGWRLFVRLVARALRAAALRARFLKRGASRCEAHSRSGKGAHTLDSSLPSRLSRPGQATSASSGLKNGEAPGSGIRQKLRTPELVAE
jgi:hypothetical protein